MTSIADDYENFEHICELVKSTAGTVRPTSEEIADALESLIRDDLAHAFDLESSPHANPVSFLRSDIEDLWYYISPNGIKRVRSVADLEILREAIDS